MARLGRRMSENDVLIEMRRLRGELRDVRARLDEGGTDGRSSFVHRRATTRQLRDRAGAALLVTLAIAAGLLCWALYRLLAATVGDVFQDLLPQPLRATTAILLEVAAALLTA